jgi:hypothetical protein
VEFDALRAAVVPGPAVVGRWPGIVCVAECADRQVLRHLLEVCAAASGPEPGRALARRLTMWLGGADAPGEGLRFGTVAITSGDVRSGGRGEQWAVFLYGSVGLVVPDRQVALSGAQAVAWTDRLLQRPDTPVVLALEGGPIPPGVIDGVHDLRAGVVPGAGVVLVPGGADTRAAEPAEESGRRRPDDPLWAEPSERERSRWGGAPEPALAAPPEGLLRGDGPSNGSPARGGLEDLAPELSPEFGGDFGERSRLSERGRAHLRPVPSGSNGMGHRGRGPRRTGTFDLGRFGVAPARNREASGEERDAGRVGPPDAGQDGPGPHAEGRSQVEEQSTDHHALPSRTDRETTGAPGVAGNAPGITDSDANDTMRNGSTETGRNGSARKGLDELAVPDDLSPLDAPFADLMRDEPVHGSGPITEPVNGSRTGADDLAGDGRNGHDLGGHDLGGHDLGSRDAESSAPDLSPWAVPERTRDAEDRADVHWFATRDERVGGESEPGRPRHGRQDGPAADEGDDDAGAGTPKFGVRAVPAEPAPAATAPPVAAVPTPAAPVEPEQPPTAPAPLRAEPVLGVSSGEDPLGPLDAGRPPGDAADMPDDPLDDSQVRGHLCPRGHLNDPRLTACAFCGTPIDAGSELVAGPRPTLGLLVFDDGATYTVDAEYLVGRMPEGDPRVETGVLRSLSVEDPSGAVSRVHAEVRVSGWDVLLTDVGSRNGTYYSGPGDPEWSQLPEGQSHRLVPGTRVRLGGRSFLFESPSGAR